MTTEIVKVRAVYSKLWYLFSDNRTTCIWLNTVGSTPSKFLTVSTNVAGSNVMIWSQIWLSISVSWLSLIATNYVASRGHTAGSSDAKNVLKSATTGSSGSSLSVPFEKTVLAYYSCKS